MINTEKFLTFNGQNYYLEISGSGQPIFLLHGFSESLMTWSELNLPDWQLFKIDLIGHGKSDKPEDMEAYQLSQILMTLHELIEHYRQGQDFALLGYSMGGRIALAYALKYPQHLDKLILESASAGIYDENLRKERRFSDEALAKQIEKNGSEWFADFWADLKLFDSQKRLPVEIQQRIWQQRASNHPIVLANTLRSTGQGHMPYLGDQISSIHAKILHLHGARDHKYTEIVNQVFKPQKNVKTMTIPNVGHNTHLESPIFFNQILKEFLNS